jgi:DNA polymerase-3 subunit epsilon
MSESVLSGRTVFADSETTGISAITGRIIEIALVEMINGKVTGRVFHELVDPEMEVDVKAEAVHKWNTESIRNELKNGVKYEKYSQVYADIKETQKFKHIAKRVKDFIGDSVVFAHNAEFDKSFFDMEYERLGEPKLSDTNKFHCTLKSANAIRPRKRNSLDVLSKIYGINTSSLEGIKNNPKVSEEIKQVCSDYGIDPTDREEHAALKDTLILAHVAQHMFTVDNELLIKGVVHETDTMSLSEVKRTKVFEGDQLILAPANSEDYRSHRNLMERISKTSGKAIEPGF